MNFYEALRLTPSATTEEVEEAYRKAARKVHPDLNQHDRMSAESRMKLLNHIRDTLTDPKRRARYDAELAEGRDRTRIETAINETLKESLNRAVFQKRLRTAILSALVLAMILVVGVWLFFHWEASQSGLPVAPPIPAAPPAPTSVVSTPKPSPVASSPATPQKKKVPKVIQFGSSIEEVLNVMGKPDLVEELPSQDLRILQYDQLRLVFRNGKLVPGSGIDSGGPAKTPR
jgi:hypothetical protein